MRHVPLSVVPVLPNPQVHVVVTPLEGSAIGTRGSNSLTLTFERPGRLMHDRSNADSWLRLARLLCPRRLTRTRRSRYGLLRCRECAMVY